MPVMHITPALMDGAGRAGKVEQRGLSQGHMKLVFEHEFRQLSKNAWITYVMASLFQQNSFFKKWMEKCRPYPRTPFPSQDGYHGSLPAGKGF
jgi:hypothetical protein